MVRVVDTAVGLERELEALSLAESIAVDTEFHPERSYLPRLFLVQLCAEGGEPVLIDPLALSLAPLGAVLSGARVVVHGGDWDLRLLAHHTGFVPTRVSDTQRVAAFAGLGWPRRLQDLLLEVLGVALDKGSTLSDWSRRPLSAAQLAYAAADVRLLLELDRVLRERVAGFGNAEWLAQAEADHLGEVLRPTDPDLAWRRVPGAQLLDDRSRTALQALAAWREKQARTADLPLNQVVPDAHLLDLARRRPSTLEEIRENRRFHSSVWKVHGAALLGCLQEGRAAPAPLPRGGQVELLRAAARAAASPRGMAGEFLLSECEMEYIVSGSGSPSWRLQALGPDFTGFRQGRVLLNFDGDLVPA